VGVDGGASLVMDKSDVKVLFRWIARSGNWALPGVYPQ